MNEDLKKTKKSSRKEHRSIFGKLHQKLKDLIWWFGEHPHWYDINIQAGFVRLFVAPVRRP